MGNKQLGLLFPIPNLWEKTEPALQNKAKLIMAQMVKQIIENNHREDNDASTDRPKNLSISSGS